MSFWKHRFSLLLGTVALGLLGLGSLWYWAYSQDDVYITYRYARNIATGVGFVFNAGEAVQGTTTPLFALLLAAVYHLTPDLVTAGNVISLLSLAGIAGVAWGLGRRFGGPWLGGSVGLLLVLNPWLYITLGMETLTYTLLLLAGFWCALHEQDEWAGLWAGLLTITRADGVLLLGVLGGAALLLRRRIPWRGGLIAAAIVGSWYLYAWAAFGTPLPQTFSAKALPFSGWQFLIDGWGWFRALYLDDQPLYGFAPVLLVVGMLVSLRRRSALVLLWSWAVIYLAGYTILNVTTFWYYAPLVPVLVLTMGYGAQAGFVWLRAWLPQRWARVGLAGASLSLLLLSQARMAYTYATVPHRIATYRLVGAWLTAHAPAEARVLVGDLGVIGWYAPQPMLDTFGLIVPGLYQRTETYAVLKYQPDYVVATQYWAWVRILGEDWFTAAYQPVAQISTAGDPEFSPIIIYQRRYSLPPLNAPVTWEAWQVQAGLPAAPIVPGPTWPLVLQAQAPAATATLTNWPVCMRTPDGIVLAAYTAPFFAGHYPATHTLGQETLTEVVWLTLPAEISQPSVEIWLGTNCTRPTQRLGTVNLRPFTAAPSPVSFGAALQLNAYHPLAPTYWAGGEIALTLHWQGQQPLARDLSVFVHVLDATGALVAQSDGWPGGLPTTMLHPTQSVVDVHHLQLPPDLLPGPYQVVVGVYDPDTNERLRLPDGQTTVTLGTFEAQWPGGDGRP